MNLDEITIDQEFIELAKAEMAKEPRLRPCKMCFHYETCVKTKGVKDYNYGAACFVTNEQMLRALLLQEKKRAAISQAKLNEKMDVMNVMVSGADMIREDVLEMLEFEYRRLDIKAKNDDATYQKNKRNLDRMAKCYAQMKASMHTFECQYRKLSIIGILKCLLMKKAFSVLSLINTHITSDSALTFSSACMRSCSCQLKMLKGSLRP